MKQAKIRFDQKADEVGKQSEHQTLKEFIRLHGMHQEAAALPMRRNDFLKVRPIKAIVKSPAFPALLRWINLITLAALIYFGWGATEEALRYTNLSSWVVWVIWWPMVIGSTLIAGRLWCTVCHLRLISDWISAIGFNRQPPKWLVKYGSSVTLAMAMGLLLLHSSVVSYDIHHIPHYTVLYLVILIVYAGAVSLIFTKGTYCKLFCPLVALFGPYAQLSPTELRSKKLGTCLKCGSNQEKKKCLQSCTNDMMMQMRSSNESCLLCFQCVKNCPNNNIRFSFRGYFADLWQHTHRSWAPVLAGIIVMGIIFQELGEEWEGFGSILLAAPHWISGFGIPEKIFGGYLWLETVCVNLGLPLLLIFSAGFMAWAFSRRGSILTYVKLYGVVLLPLVFSAHFAKLLNKFNTKLGYAPYVFTDPKGHHTAAAIQAGTLAKPLPVFFSNHTMGWILLGIVAIGLAASIYSLIRVSRNTYRTEFAAGVTTAIPFAFLCLICGTGFLLTIYHWLVV